MNTRFILVTSLTAVIIAACTTPGNAPIAGSGGIPSAAGGTTQGGTPTGGTIGSGGTSATGGAVSGGMMGSGGTVATGGTKTGGSSGSGGTSSTGGIIGTGGARTGGNSGTGGTLATGGSVTAGGATAAGGSVNPGSGGAVATGGSGAGGVATGGARTGGTTSTGGSGTCTASSTGSANTVIDVCTKYQKITGIGHSFAWTTHTDAEMELLWDIDKGAGLSIARSRVDESTRDSGLVKSTSNQNQIKMAKVAISKGVVVWAAPWGPGKDWQTVYGTNSKGQDQIKFNMTYAPQWAAALAQYVKDMKAAGVPLVGLSAQNEPDGDNFNHFEAADLTTWIRDYLGPALEGTGVPVIAPETVNWCSFPTYKSSIMNDAKASSYVPIIATHEYGCSPKAYPEINQAGKEFWETEIYDDNATADPGIESGLRTAKLMHEALTIASVNAWHYWWGHGGANDGLFPNNSSTPTKRLWVMGNFARFVRPGFVRIAAPASPATGLTMSAYYGAATNRVVVVAINTTTAAVSRTFGVSGLTPTKVTPWVTDASNDLQAQTAVSLSGNQFTYAIPAKSVTSLVIDQ